MRTDNKAILKYVVPTFTHIGCYGDDLWLIPLQTDGSVPEVYENGLVDNHGQPYIEIFHADDELPENHGKKNMWRVKIQRMNEDNEYEIYAQDSFKTAHQAVNSRIVTGAMEKAANIQKVKALAYNI